MAKLNIVNGEAGSSVRTKLNTVDSGATDDQTGAEVKVAYEAEANTNAFTDAEQTKLTGIETSATADQSNAEIETAYNTQVAIVSQVNAEAGISTTAERWTPQRVAQAIAALGGGDALTTDPLSQFTASGTTSAQLAGVISDETGSGLLCFATSPTLTTPVLGVATATTVNKVTFTAPATGSTLTIAEGATLTAPSTASVSGTNTGDQTITLTGDVTGTGTGSFAATIAADSVTYDKMQDTSGTDVLLGRSTAGAGTVEEIACTAAGRAIIDDASATAQRTTLGLGTIATQASSSVSITGGSVTGITDITVADGGTGASTAQAAIDTLTAVSGATNEHVLTKDTGTGNAVFKVKTRSITIYAVEFATAVSVADGVAYFRVPVELNGLDLTAVGAQIGTQSTSGTPTVQLARMRAATAGGARTVVDILSTLITIDINEWDSKDATAAAVINAANDDMQTGDLIRVDVDVAGTGTQGLFVSLQFS